MHKNTALERIEALPLPIESRADVLAVARELPEPEQEILLQTLSQRLIEFGQQSLAHQQRVLEALASTVEQLRHDVHTVDRQVEQDDREGGLSAAETNLQLSA
jgi:hypothetical protein